MQIFIIIINFFIFLNITFPICSMQLAVPSKNGVVITNTLFEDNEDYKFLMSRFLDYGNIITWPEICFKLYDIESSIYCAVDRGNQQSSDKLKRCRMAIEEDERSFNEPISIGKYIPSQTYSQIASLKELCAQKISQLCRDHETDKYDIEKLKAMKYWYAYPTLSSNDPEVVDNNDPEITTYTVKSTGKKFQYISPDPTDGFYRSFENFSVGELEKIFECPGFLQAIKQPLLEEAYAKANYKDNCEYEKNTYNRISHLLDSIAFSCKDAELKEQIKSYSQKVKNKEYDINESYDLLDKVFCLPQITDELKEEIFTLKVKANCGGKFEPYNLLEKAMEYSSCKKESEFSFYNKIIDYNFQHYPLSAAKILSHIVATGQNLETRTAFAVIKGHNKLQYVADNADLYFVENIVKHIVSLRLFFEHGVEFPLKTQKAIVQNAVKVGNFQVLRLLENKGFDFSDPLLLDGALETKNPISIGFMLDQQRNSLQENPDFFNNLFVELMGGYLSNFTSKSILLGKDHDKYISKYGGKAVVGFMFAHNSGNTIPLEVTILNFSADMQKLKNIRDVVDEIKKRSADQEIDDAVNRALTIVSTEDALQLIKKYPTCLENLIKTVEDYNQTINIDFRDLIDSQRTLFALGARTAFFVVTSALLVNKVSRLDFNKAVDGAGDSGVEFFQHFENHTKTYNEIMTKIKPKRFYLEGLLRGLQDECDKLELNFKEPKNETAILNKLRFQNIGYRFLLPLCGAPVLFLPVIFIVTKSPNMIFGCLALGLGLLLEHSIFSKIDDFFKQKIYKNATEDVQKLFEYNVNQGILNGFARKNEEQFLPEESKGEPSKFSLKSVLMGVINYPKNTIGGLVQRIKGLKFRNPDLRNQNL